jgi:hypothetical protein
MFAAVGRSTEPAGAHATSSDHTAMDRAERRCRERGEDERVRGDVSGDTLLCAPGQSGGDEEVGVPAVAL